MMSLSGDSTAVSLDGRHFQFEGGRGATFDPGGFVTLRSHEGTALLGQVNDVILGKRGTLHGTGTILGVIAEGRVDDSRPVAFEAAQMETADAATVGLLYGAAGQLLHIGSQLGAEGTPAHLLPRRFNRHTFWCGQSGSGKTYALGVVLEQLLVRTRLPIVVLDPNADFVKLRERSGSEDSDESRSLSERAIRILRPSSPIPDALRVRYLDLPVRAKAALLHLDPLENRSEYNELMHLEETLGTIDTATKIVPRLRERGTPTSEALAARIENLRLTDWSVWAGKLEAVTDVINGRPDATVLDLGGFEFPDESLVVALAVLEDLWAHREERRPILIVIDEAHNLCSPDETSPLHVAVRERIIQIAAEGRKFGLWLLLSTQRPSRIHPSIISQCDNLALMKMTSPIDLDELARIFGFVPLAMLARSPRFRQGEALFAGSFVPAPTMVTIGARLTREGGADVGVPFRS